MSKPGQFASSVRWTMVSSMALMVAGLVTGSVTAKILGVVGRGELASIQLLGSLLAGFCTAGLPPAVLYFSGTDAKRAGDYYWTGMALAMLLAVPSVLAGYLLAPMVLEQYGPAVVLAARVYLLFIPLCVCSSFVLASLQGQMRIGLWNLLRSLAYILWLVPVLAMYMLESVSAPTFASAYLVFLGFYVAVFLVIRHRTLAERPQFSRPLVEPLARYAGSTTIANLTQQSNIKLDQLVIAASLPPKELGLYVVALAWSAAYGPLVAAVAHLIVPYVSRLEAGIGRTLAVAQISRCVLIMNLLLGAALIVITPTSIRLLFGTDFADAVPVAYILICAAFFANMKTVLCESLRGVGHPHFVMKTEVGGMLVTAVLLALAVKMEGGLLAIGIASAVGYLFTCVYLACGLAARLESGLGSLLIPSRADFLLLLRGVRAVLQEWRVHKPKEQEDPLA